MGASDTLLGVGLLIGGAGLAYYLYSTGSLGGLLGGGQGQLPPLGDEFIEGEDEFSLEGDMIEGTDFQLDPNLVVDLDDDDDKKKKKKKKDKDDDDDDDYDFDYNQYAYQQFQPTQQPYPSQPYPQPQPQYQQPVAPVRQSFIPHPLTNAPPGTVSSTIRYPIRPADPSQFSPTVTTYSPYSPYNQFYQYYQYQPLPASFRPYDDNINFTDIDTSKQYIDYTGRIKGCSTCKDACKHRLSSTRCRVCRQQCKKVTIGSRPDPRFYIGQARPQGAFLATIWNTVTDGFIDMDDYMDHNRSERRSQGRRGRDTRDKHDCHNRLLRMPRRERYNKRMVSSDDYHYNRNEIQFAVQ